MEYTTPELVASYMMMRRGEPRNVSANVADGQPDINMGVNVVYFQAGMTVNISDSAAPLGEDVIVKSVSGTTITLTTDLVNAYTTARAAKVFSYCPFNPRSLPSYNDVSTLIETIEAEMDKKMRKTFLSTGRVHKEWITVELKNRISWPYMQAPDSEDASSRRGFQLSKRPLVKFDRDADTPDQIMLKINSDLVDILDPANGYVIWYVDDFDDPNRSLSDIWVDQVNSVVYIMDTVALDYGFKDSYCVYHHSELALYDSLPGDIRKAANMLVSAEILMNDRYANNFPSDTEAMIKPGQQVGIWKANAYEIIARHRDMSFRQGYQ